MSDLSLTDRLFAYPSVAHVRQHGPRGYADYRFFKPWLRDEFAFRCVYCLWRERWEKDGHAVFSTDHVIPRTVAPERIGDYENLVYASLACNSSKQAASLPDPCREPFAAVLRVRDNGVIEGLTPEGQRMVSVLNLNRPRVKEFWHRLLNALRVIHLAKAPVPPHLLRDWLSYPDDLPNLAILQPPGGNTRPAGIRQSHFHRRQRQELPDIY